MTRRLMIAGMVAVLMAGGATLAAHQSFRIIGTISKVTATSIDVKQAKDGKVIGMDMDKATMVMRAEKKLTIGDLKPGLSVVVDARGDSIDELLVRKVMLVVAAPTRK